MKNPVTLTCRNKGLAVKTLNKQYDLMLHKALCFNSCLEPNYFEFTPEKSVAFNHLACMRMCANGFLDLNVWAMKF